MKTATVHFGPSSLLLRKPLIRHEKYVCSCKKSMPYVVYILRRIQQKMKWTWEFTTHGTEKRSRHLISSSTSNHSFSHKLKDSLDTTKYRYGDGYLKRFYLSDWTAANFISVDDSAGKYEFISYYNNSATINIPGLKNWIYTVWNIDNSIVRKHTGRALNVLKRSFPRKFTCNRDEWLDDSSTVLDCDLLFGPLRFSILDFIMINFLPLIIINPGS